MNIKLIVTDIDGTLMNDHNEIPCEIFQIIKYAHNHNIEFVVASGRLITNLKDIFKNACKDIIFIAQNGAYIESKGHTLFCDKINKDKVIAIMKQALEVDLKVMLYTETKIIVTDSSKVFLDKLNNYNVEYILSTSEEIDLNNICKISLMSVAESINIHHKNLFSSIEGISVYISNEDMLDITNNHTNKGRALQYIQQMMNFSTDETVTFGDSENDIEMFRFSKYSYAMGNANENVKNSARYLAPCNNNNGVVSVLTQYLGLNIGV